MKVNSGQMRKGPVQNFCRQNSDERVTLLEKNPRTGDLIPTLETLREA